VSTKVTVFLKRAVLPEIIINSQYYRYINAEYRFFFVLPYIHYLRGYNSLMVCKHSKLCLYVSRSLILFSHI